MKTFEKVSKKELLKELNWHLEQDKIIQGCYGNIGNNFKGCHMGCVANSIARINGVYLKPYYHQEQAEYLYGDKSCEWFVRLCEKIFEGLGVDESKRWVAESFSAIPEGILSESLNSIENPIKIFILEKTKGYHNNKDVLRSTDRVIEALTGNGDIVNARDAAYAAYNAAYDDYTACNSACTANGAAYNSADAAYGATSSAVEAADSAARASVHDAAYTTRYLSKFYEELAAFVIKQIKALGTDLRKETELIKGE